MRQNFILFAILFLVANAYSQTDLKPFTAKPYKALAGHASPNGTCDSLNLYAANNWSAFYYEYQSGGAVFGNCNINNDEDSPRVFIFEDANYFDVSASDYHYITGGLAYFASANSNIPANLSKNITFKLYRDNDGVPGGAIDSVKITLGQVHQDVLQGRITEFKFATPVKLPSSKKFYISIDHQDLEWTPNIHDSIAIVATGDDATVNTAFQFIKDSTVKNWYPVNQFWIEKKDTLDVSLFIFPYVTSTLDACSVLPVSIFNFGGTIKNSQAYLNWSTAVESNNKGFYVERSKDGKEFASLGFVKGAVNSSQITNYSYTDVSLKDINVSKTYYRLNQVDLDGKSTYSNVISLSLDNLANAGKWKLYPNPVKEKATVELNLEAASKVKAQLIARDGKILLNIDKGVLNEGIQQFYINTQSIAKGSYILRVTIGDKTYSRLLVKE